MKVGSRKAIASALLCGSILATTPDAWAQASNPASSGTRVTSVDRADTDGLEDIIVTARRTEERSQDVPVAVTAFSGKALEQLKINDVRALGNIAPGLTVAEANSPATLIITIRGLANVNPSNGSDAAVGYYFNDVPINLQNGTNLGLFDVQNVQVLKGPQGTLFGRNSTGGALLINAARPTDNFEGHVQAGGTFFRVGNGLQGEAVFNLPVTPTLAVRLGARIVDREGFVRNILPRNTPDIVYGTRPLPAGRTDFKNLLGEKSQAWRVGVLWTPSDTVENLTFYDGAHFKGNGLPTFATALNPNGPLPATAVRLGLPDPVAAYADLIAARKDYYWTTYSVANTPLVLKTHTVSNTTTINLGDDLLLKNIAGYRHIDEGFYQDIVGLPGPYFTLRQGTRGYNLTNELQVQGKSLDGRLNWVLGGFYFQERRHYTVGPSVAFGGPGSLTNYISHSKSYSAFAQGTFKITDALSFTAGGRYNIDKRRAMLTRFRPASATVPAACGFIDGSLTNCTLNGDATFKAFTYTLSLDYKIDPDTLVYVTSRRGYRSGGYNTSQIVLKSGYVGFKPEFLTDYEFGFKRDWGLGGDVTLRTNLAVFYDDYKNIQRLAVDPNDFRSQVIINARKSSVKGGELEINMQVGKWLNLGYSYALAIPEYTNFIVGNFDYSDNTFGYASRHNHAASARVTLPVGDDKGEVVFGAAYHHQSQQFYDGLTQTTQNGTYPPNTFGFGGFGILNFNVAWNSVMGSSFDVSGFIKNATNTKILPNGSPATYTGLGASLGYYSQPPLMAGFDIRYNF